MALPRSTRDRKRISADKTSEMNIVFIRQEVS